MPVKKSPAYAANVAIFALAIHLVAISIDDIWALNSVPASAAYLDLSQQ